MTPECDEAVVAPIRDDEGRDDLLGRLATWLPPQRLGKDG